MYLCRYRLSYFHCCCNIMNFPTVGLIKDYLILLNHKPPYDSEHCSSNSLLITRNMKQCSFVKPLTLFCMDLFSHAKTMTEKSMSKFKFQHPRHDTEDEVKDVTPLSRMTPDSLLPQPETQTDLTVRSTSHRFLLNNCLLSKRGFTFMKVNATVFIQT